MKLYLVADEKYTASKAKIVLQKKAINVFDKFSDGDGLLHLEDMLACDAVIIVSEVSPFKSFDFNIALNNNKDIIIVNSKYCNHPRVVQIAKARFQNIEEVKL